MKTQNENRECFQTNQDWKCNSLSLLAVLSLILIYLHVLVFKLFKLASPVISIVNLFLAFCLEYYLLLLVFSTSVCIGFLLVSFGFFLEMLRKGVYTESVYIRCIC